MIPRSRLPHTQFTIDVDDVEAMCSELAAAA
jgi:hypothetical protein